MIGELGDILGALIPPHDGATVLTGLHKHQGSGGGHQEPLLIGKLVTPLLVN